MPDYLYPLGYWSLCRACLTHDDAAYSLLGVALVPSLCGPHEPTGEVLSTIHARPYSGCVVDPAFIALCVLALTPGLSAVRVVQTVRYWLSCVLFHDVVSLVFVAPIELSPYGLARRSVMVCFRAYLPSLRGRACRPS